MDYGIPLWVKGTVKIIQHPIAGSADAPRRVTGVTSTARVAYLTLQVPHQDRRRLGWVVPDQARVRQLPRSAPAPLRARLASRCRWWSVDGLVVPAREGAGRLYLAEPGGAVRRQQGCRPLSRR